MANAVIKLNPRHEYNSKTDTTTLIDKTPKDFARDLRNTDEDWHYLERDVEGQKFYVFNYSSATEVVVSADNEHWFEVILKHLIEHNYRYSLGELFKEEAISIQLV